MNDDKHPAESVAPCDHFPVEFAAQGERDAFHAALHTTLGEAVRAQEVMRLADAWVDAECRARGLRTTEDMLLRSWVAYMRDSRDKAEARAKAAGEQERRRAMYFTGTRIGVSCGTTPLRCRLLAGLRTALIDNEFGGLIDAISAGVSEDVRISLCVPTPPEGEEAGWAERVMVSVRDAFLRGAESHDPCPMCLTGAPADRKWGVVPWADGGAVAPMLGDAVPEDHPYAVHARETAAAEARILADAAAYRDLVRLRRVEEYRAEDGVVLWWSGGVPVEISDWDGSPDWTDAWSPVPKAVFG